MLDKNALSKQKYIYYVYDADAGKTMHIERFPVVYINSKYVYYKHSRKHELEKVYLGDVKDTLANVFEKDYKFVYSRDRYFWNTAENPEEVVATLKKVADERRIEKNKSWAEKELERARRAYEDAQKRYDIWANESEKKGVAT